MLSAPEMWARHCLGDPSKRVRGVGRFLPWFVSFMIAALFLCVRDGFAYPITLSFKTAAGQGVSSIKIRGTRGINALALLTSDVHGHWTFDTNSLSGLDGVIVFSGVNTGMQLSPAEVKVSELVSRGVRNLTILATPSAQPSTIVSWSFYSSGTTPLRNQPVSLLNPQSLSCEQRLTDENGYVVWSVLRPRARCDGLSDSTGWLQIVPHEASGVRCSTFSTYRSIGMKSCPLTGDDEAGVSAASCSVVSNPAPSLSSRFQISVQAAGTTLGVQGVELVGNSNFMALSQRVTNSLGNVIFSLGSVAGATPTTVFDIIPIASGYEFIPRKRSTRECAFSGSDTYTCKFAAIRSFSSQGALVIDVAQAGQPLSGVSMPQPAAGLGCMEPEVKFSDLQGRVIIPVRTRTACDSSPQAPAWLSPVPLFPALVGKRFMSSSDFSYCPSSLLTSAAIQAFDAGSGVQNYSITGRVVALDGGAFSGVPILMNGQEASRTDAQGRFEIFPVAQGASARIEARLAPYAFDPEFETFTSVGRNVETTIMARAPDPLGGGIEPPEATCPVKGEYSLSGRVIGRSGAPIQGALIHNRNQEEPSATTDENGNFSISVPFGSDNWVTVEHAGSLFSPAGRSLVETVCDEDRLYFQQVDFESATVSGRVVLTDGSGVGALPIKVEINGAPIGFSIVTANDGSFMFTAPLGSDIKVSVDSNSYTFLPEAIGPLTVQGDVSGQTFTATPVQVVVPTAIPTFAPPIDAPGLPTAPPSSTVPPPSAPTGAPVAPGPPTLPTMPAPQPTSVQPPGSGPVQPPPATPFPVPPTPKLPTWPTMAPGSTIAPPQFPSPVQPTFQPPVNTWPTTPPVMWTPPGVMPTLAPTNPPPGAPTQQPVQTATPLPALLAAARCPPDAARYDWVVINQGNTRIEDLRWRVFDAIQPSTAFEGGFLSLAPGELVEIFDTPGLGIPARFYRFAVFTKNSAGQEIVLAVVAKNSAECLPRKPSPEPPSATPPQATPAPGLPPDATTPAPEPTSMPVPITPPVVPTIPVIEPIPTVPPTATAAPTASFEVSVEVKNMRGRTPTDEQFEQLAPRGILVIKGRAGTIFEHRVPLSGFTRGSFDYTTSLPRGSYRISFEGRVRVVSVFRRDATSFVCTVGQGASPKARCPRIPFALQPLAGAKQTTFSRGRTP